MPAPSQTKMLQMSPRNTIITPVCKPYLHGCNSIFHTLAVFKIECLTFTMKYLKCFCTANRDALTSYPINIALFNWHKTKTHKNLGFCIIEKRTYTEHVCALLSEVNLYTCLTFEEAPSIVNAVSAAITEMLQANKDFITKTDQMFITYHLNCATDPFAVFYPLFNIHRTPVATCPVVSYSGSLLYTLALTQAQEAYLTSSFVLTNSCLCWLYSNSLHYSSLQIPSSL